MKMKIEKKKRERNKTREKHVMQMKNYCSPPASQCPSCSQAVVPCPAFPLVYILTSYSMEYPFSQLWSAYLLPGQHEKLCSVTTKPSVCYQRCSLPKSNHSTILTTRKRINSIPDEIRTKEYVFLMIQVF